MTEPIEAKEGESMRMEAYYYAFTPTGVREIDIILSAIACAGKAYHHTDCWQDDCEPYENVHRGHTPVEWIYRAAEDAAKAFREIAERNATTELDRDYYRALVLGTWFEADTVIASARRRHARALIAKQEAQSQGSTTIPQAK